jgi:hypothetical protein
MPARQYGSQLVAVAPHFNTSFVSPVTSLILPFGASSKLSRRCRLADGVVADRVGFPFRAVEQVLHAVRDGVASVLGQGPAVCAR